MSESERITVKLPDQKPKTTPSRGRMMDFAPRKRSTTVSTATVRPQPQPRLQPQAQPRTQAQVQVHTRTATRRVTSPSTAHPPMSRPSHMSSPATATRPDTTPVRPSRARHHVSRPAPATTNNDPIQPLEAYNDLDNYTDFDDLTLGIIEDLDEPLDQRILEEPPAPEPKKPKKYGLLPTKAPFINTEKLEKRPLSALRADKSAKSAIKPRKNVYTSRLSEASKEKDAPTLVTTSASKKSNFGLVIAIIITLILGAIVGGIAYLAFFQ